MGLAVGRIKPDCVARASVPVSNPGGTYIHAVPHRLATAPFDRKILLESTPSVFFAALLGASGGISGGPFRPAIGVASAKSVSKDPSRRACRIFCIRVRWPSNRYHGDDGGGPGKLNRTAIASTRGESE
jgi:hypothetical protein